MQMPMPQNMLESEMIGAIKIKDGLFIGDELASTVSYHPDINFGSFFLSMNAISLIIPCTEIQPIRPTSCFCRT